MTQHIKILLADDHAITREGLAGLLSANPGFEVVAQAKNGSEAVRLAQKHAPDVIVMDISMPELNGVNASKQILAQLPQTKIIALSMHTGARYVDLMFKAGAHGYLSKESALQDVVVAINTVLRGKYYLSPELSATLVEDFVLPADRHDSPEISSLTDREKQVLQLLAESKSTKEIAKILNVSVYTVDTHRRNIIDKLHIRDVAGLTKFAIREGLTTPEY